MLETFLILLSLLFGGSQLSSATEATRGGVDPWGTPTATGEPTSDSTDPGTETDTRGGVDPWG